METISTILALCEWNPPVAGRVAGDLRRRAARYDVTFKSVGCNYYQCLNLSHLPLVPHVCVSQSGQHCFR